MGGGAAGKISYPEYIAILHSSMLDSDGGTPPDLDIVTAFNTAIPLNPFMGESAFIPDDELAKAYSDLVVFRTLADAMNPTLDYSNALLSMEIATDGFMNTDYITGNVPTITIDDTSLAADAQAYADIQNQLLENTILPPWKAGMLNINAVTSSAFVIGEGIIRALNQQDIAKYTSGVRAQISTKNAEYNAEFIKQREDFKQKFNIQRNEVIRQLSTSVVEAIIKKIDTHSDLTGKAISYSQIHIAGKYDESDAELTIRESDIRWEISLFKDVGAFIGAMQGGGASGAGRRPNRAASIAGGAVSGAASGASIGSAFPGYGTVIGAAAGAIIGAGGAALSTS